MVAFRRNGLTYVDDVMYGVDGEDEAYKLCVLSKKVLADGGLNLLKFVKLIQVISWQEVYLVGRKFLM